MLKNNFQIYKSTSIQIIFALFGMAEVLSQGVLNSKDILDMKNIWNTS